MLGLHALSETPLGAEVPSSAGPNYIEAEGSSVSTPISGAVGSVILYGELLSDSTITVLATTSTILLTNCESNNETTVLSESSLIVLSNVTSFGNVDVLLNSCTIFSSIASSSSSPTISFGASSINQSDALSTNISFALCESSHWLLFVVDSQNSSIVNSESANIILSVASTSTTPSSVATTSIVNVSEVISIGESEVNGYYPVESEANGSVIVQSEAQSESSIILSSEFSSVSSPTGSCDLSIVLQSIISGNGLSSIQFISSSILLANGGSTGSSLLIGELQIVLDTPNPKLLTKQLVRKPLLLAPRDRSIQVRQSKDLFKLAVSSITYFVKEGSDREPEDSFYLESPDQEVVLGKQYNSRAFIKKKPFDVILKKFGVEETRDIYVEIRRDYLVEKCLPIPTIGSYFVVEKELYRITEVKDIDYLNNYNSKINNNVNYMMLGMKVKGSTYKDIQFVENGKMKSLFFSRNDKSNTVRQSGDFFKLSVSSITYFVKEGSDKEPEDSFYLESPDQELVLGKRYSVRAYVNMKELIAIAEKFGTEEHRNIQIEIKKNDLVVKNKPLPIVGSFFVIEKEFYRVISVVNSGYTDFNDSFTSFLVIGRKVKGSMFNNVELVENEKLSTLFYGKQDMKHISESQSSLYKKAFVKYTFIERLTDDNVDLLYLENLNKNNLPGIHFDLPAFVRTNPSKKKLKKFGIVTERDLQIELSYVLSKKYMEKVPNIEKIETTIGPDGLPDIGSVMIFRDEPYVILDSRPQYYFGNTEKRVGKYLFANKLKSSVFVEEPLTSISEEAYTVGIVDPYGD